jgi:hypothetical protein
MFGLGLGAMSHACIAIGVCLDASLAKQFGVLGFISPFFLKK